MVPIRRELGRTDRYRTGSCFVATEIVVCLEDRCLQLESLELLEERVRHARSPPDDKANVEVLTKTWLVEMHMVLDRKGFEGIVADIRATVHLVRRGTPPAFRSKGLWRQSLPEHPLKAHRLAIKNAVIRHE